ncbi:MAG TPA: hypothetical protein VGR51_10585 [Thermoplasmata archaeon]|nr:hypothetical protein [Thermoplasmata archaeon]
MSLPPPEDPGPSMAYRNAVTVVVIGSIFAVLAFLYLLLLPGAGGTVGAICTVAFLFVAFVGWEYLMKPGYGILHRRTEIGPVEEPEEPSSPRAP